MSAKRNFRGKESLQAEHRTRSQVRKFLTNAGYQVAAVNERKVGTATVQTVLARTAEGRDVVMRVRLCWRTREPRDERFAAAQLRAKLVEGSWSKTLRAIEEHAHQDQLTHFLFVERRGHSIRRAALVPVDQLRPIWEQQRKTSSELIQAGAMGRVRKNHAENGTSPTLWLRDDRNERSHEVADILWTWPGVVLLEKGARTAVDDTFDDCAALTYEQYGSDGAKRVLVQRSQVARDPRVRRKVLERAGFTCEQSDCGEKRNYPHFLDVHHILGAEKSDRVWNCVALCPNCHRAAHVAPTSTEINAKLLTYAEQFLKQKSAQPS